jgi:hypothetical protein
MKSSAALFRIALALGAITLAPWPSVQAQDPRQEGPIEIEKCQTIEQPGSYKLVNNLTAPAGGVCLVIAASFVTIDLAGFTISGSGTGSSTMGTGAGIRAEPNSNGSLFGIAVRNGSISTSGLAAALDLSSAEGSIVEGLRVAGIAAQSGPAIAANGIVKGNTVVGFGGTPGAGAAIFATGTVTGNYVSDNRHGMDIGPGSTVIGNTVSNNAETGIHVGCPSNITDNTAVNNGEFNLELSGTGCNNTNNVAP